MFYDEFQKKVDKAWKSERSEFNFEFSLPSKIKYLCFANFSEEKKGNVDEELYREISLYKNRGNLFLYPASYSCNMPAREIKHLNLEKIIEKKNPYCISAERGFIKIEKPRNSNLVILR